MFRLFAAAALVLVVLAITGVVSLAWLITTRLGIDQWRGLVAVGVGALLAVALAARAFWMMRRFASPLGAIMDAAQNVAAGDYTTRVEERGPPPLRALVRSFNTMTEKLQHADRQRRDLMADVAHELRTPLSVLQGRIEGGIDGVYPLEPAELERLLEQTQILSRLVDDLRTVALSDAGALTLQKEPTNVGELLSEVVTSLQPEAVRRSVALRAEGTTPGVTLDVDPVRIKEVLVNLVSNALSHTPAGGAVGATLTLAERGVTIAVADTGSGMSAEEVARMFDRFYKGAESRGSGLGLAIARGLTRAHGGELTATSAPGRGTTVRFELPRS